MRQPYTQETACHSDFFPEDFHKDSYVLDIQYTPSQSDFHFHKVFESHPEAPSMQIQGDCLCRPIHHLRYKPMTCCLCQGAFVLVNHPA